MDSSGNEPTLPGLALDTDDGCELPGDRVAFRLRALGPECHGRYLLPPGTTTVGSSAFSDVVLSVRGVSRVHASFEVVGRKILLRDAGSTNGTFVGDRRIGRTRVEPGTKVLIGPVAFLVEVVDPGDVELAIVLAGEEVRRGRLVAEDSTTELRAFGSGGAAYLRFPADLCFPQGFFRCPSEPMLRLYGEAVQLARSDLPILLEGETGVGKELIARLLHASSVGPGAPFVAINCAAIPGDLLEAELFGIAEGVATGVRRRVGRFSEARGGTLFLDEVGEMPLALQAKLLRALQEKQAQPVGGKPYRLDVRILAATNQDLRQQVQAGSFRQDLYFRIAGCTLRVPPLRARPGDIRFLFEQFLRKYAEEAGVRIRGVSSKALRRLENHDWPGNVRELENEARRLVHRTPPGGLIDSEALAVGAEPATSPNEREASSSLRLADRVAVAERETIREALAAARGSQRKAALLLGISRNTLARKLRALAIALPPGSSGGVRAVEGEPERDDSLD